jgi:hypothetical protein
MAHAHDDDFVVLDPVKDLVELGKRFRRKA